MPRFFPKTGLFLAFVAAQAFPAAGLAADKLTPDGAVALALENHPAVRAAASNVEGAEADQRAARSGWMPRVDLTEEYMRSTNPVFVFASKLGQERFGPSDFAIDSLNTPDPFTNSATRLSVRQSLWNGGRTRLMNRAAKIGVEAAELSGQRTRQEIAFGAKQAFWNAVLAGRMLEVARAGEKAARANLDLATKLAESGMVVSSDRMQAEVRAAEVKAMRIRAEMGAGVARAALRQALGIDEQRDFELDPPDIGPQPPGETAEELVRRALDTRADYRVMQAREKQADLGERIATSGWFPDVGAGAQYEWNSTTPFGNDGSNWAVGATVRIPIFSGLETKARRDKARAQHEELRSHLEAMAEGIRLEVSAAWADKESASERLRAADSALGSADEALRIVKDRYEEGMAVMVELLGAEAARTQVQGNRALAQRDLAVAIAALDLAVSGDSAAAAPIEESDHD